MATYLITGTSRGLGAEFVKQILESENGSKVIAGARNPSSSALLVSLQQQFPNRLSLVALDVDSTDSVKAAAQQIAKTHESIDYLINNAGVTGVQPSTVENMATVLNTNVLGVFRVIQEFLPFLRKGNKKTVFTISSMMGSIALQKDMKTVVERLHGSHSDSYSYRTSKAAANALTVMLAEDFRQEGISFVTVHPGLVETDMFHSNHGGKKASDFTGFIISPEVSVTSLLTVLHKLTIEDTGKFYKYDGSILPF